MAASIKKEGKRTSALVTGGSGFIGSHLVAALMEKNWQVTVLIRETTAASRLENRGIHLVRGNFADKSSLRKAVSGMDYIFHAAAIIYGSSREMFYQANVQSTENLLAACVEENPMLKKFVYVSSIAASGPSVKGRLKNEDDECRPISFYGESKLAAEEITRRYGVHIPFAIIRPPSVIGLHQRELETLLLTIENGILPQLGNGDKQTCICSVEDVVRALILVAETAAAAGRTYFISDNNIYSWRELLAVAARAMGKKNTIKVPYPLVFSIALISEAAARFLDAKKLVNMIDIVQSRKYYWLYSSDRIHRELGFSPRTGYEQAIERIIEAYRADGFLPPAPPAG